MYERCISTWSSTGSMRPPEGGSSVLLSVTGCHFLLDRPKVSRLALLAPRPAERSDVEEADVFCVALDERPALLDVLAHQDGEHLVGLGGVLQGHLQEQPVVGVGRGVPQLVGVHLAETLVE